MTLQTIFIVILVIAFITSPIIGEANTVSTTQHYNSYDSGWRSIITYKKPFDKIYVSFSIYTLKVHASSYNLLCRFALDLKNNVTENDVSNQTSLTVPINTFAFRFIINASLNISVNLTYAYTLSEVTNGTPLPYLGSSTSSSPFDLNFALLALIFLGTIVVFSKHRKV